jgi:predicted CXXCH cytochrome family protein
VPRRYALRALLALSLALGCVLSVASIAYAGTESTYAAWVDSVQYHWQPHDTPHNDYATTTTKCAVCHAVHKAPAGGELLLQSTVDQACVYCHIDTSVGIRRVYGGLVANYTVESDHGHQSGGVTCVDCHAVHGANTFQGSADTKILKVWNIQQTFVDDMAHGDRAAIVNAGVSDRFPLAPADDPSSWDSRTTQDAAFCSQCHPYYSYASETTVTAQVVQSDGTFLEKKFKTHPLKRPGGEMGKDAYVGFEASGSTLPTSESVAVLSTRGCFWSCHSGASRGDSISNPEESYPHYSASTSRFLAGGAGFDAVTDSSNDSNCLMCHVWAEGDGGGAGAPTDGGVGASY